MEIKLQCNCGTKFKFEFEPVDGRVPFAVTCPTCKADATEFANAHVAQQLGAVAPQVAAEPVAADAGRPKLRIGGASHAPAPAVAEPALAMAAPVAAPAPRPAPIMPTSAAYTNLTPPDEGLTAHFFYGVGGAVLGTALGCLIWYLIFHFTGKSWRIFALLAGAGGGFGARLASKDEGSSQLGMITCVVVLCGLIFTAYTIGRNRVHHMLDGGFAEELYSEQVAYAKRAVKAVPTASDDEIRAFLAKEESDGDVKTKPTAIKAHDVRMFKEVKLAQYQQLADGKVKEGDYFKTLARWGFDERVAEAKIALEAVPHESEKEIRDYLAAEAVEGSEKPAPDAVTADEIAAFKNETLPEYKKLASGEQQFVELPDITKSAHKNLDKAEEENGWVRVLYFFSGWGIGGIGLMFVTLGLAYKTSTHASG